MQCQSQFSATRLHLNLTGRSSLPIMTLESENSQPWGRRILGSVKKDFPMIVLHVGVFENNFCLWGETPLKPESPSVRRLGGRGRTQNVSQGRATVTY
jgi:hypothetical protein